MSGEAWRFGRDLCKALGLDPQRVQSITLIADAGRAPVAIVTFADFDGEQVVRTVSEYRFAPPYFHPATEETNP